MIQDIIFRAFCFSSSSSPPIIYPSCLSLPPRCCSLSVEGPIYHPPVLSIALLPHATLLYTELQCLQFFLVPLPATRLSRYFCILLVRLLYLPVCLSASVLLFSVTKAGYLHTLGLCIYLLK